MNDYLSPDALKLLHSAAFLEPPNFMCFGKYYTQLRKLDLIDNEYNVTFMGRQFIKFCISQGVFDEK